MGRYQVGRERAQRGDDFAHGAQVAQWVNPPLQKPQREKGNSGFRKLFRDRTVPPQKHRGLVSELNHCSREIAHVDAGAPDRVGPRDDVDDLHSVTFRETITRKANLRKTARAATAKTGTSTSAASAFRSGRSNRR